MFKSIFHDDLDMDQLNTNENPSTTVASERQVERTGATIDSTNVESSSPNASKYSHVHKKCKISGIGEQKSQDLDNDNSSKPLCSSSSAYLISPLHLNSKVQVENSKVCAVFPDLTSSIVQFRNEIDNIANCCISEILHENERIRSLSQINVKYSEKFTRRIKNLLLQQDEFERFVLSTRSQLIGNSAQNSSIDTGLIVKNLQKESALFKQFFPAYGVKQDILNKIKNNHVLVIGADCAYFLNLALPFMLFDAYKKHSLIACESNEVLAQILADRINSVFSGGSQQLFDAELSVLSEEGLLKQFFHATLSAGEDFCLVYNVPLKRSVVTDIVLANLRDLLLLQKNSKLILLLSPFDDIPKFTSYFSSKLSVSVLNLPNLCLPVKTVWKTGILSPSNDFQDDVVKTIFAIHAICETGDIMVFLPSLQDARTVFEALIVKAQHYQYDDINFFCLDGENLKPFVELKIMSSKRKVFLLTNDYAGLTLPSARYVVDCGIQKQCSYDLQTDADILVPSFISRVRAKVVKQLVGTFHVGVCFRIYNKSNFLRNMHSKEHAEMFCINPLHSIMKIFQHRSYKSKSFQFVESLPKNIVENALKLLESYGAVDSDLCVTSFGEEMVKIPLPMKYSRLILFGLRSGFSYETIALVAFFSVKTELFVESTGEDHQKLIDVIKFNFNQFDSDTITFLNIFKLWKETGFKKLWGNENFLNFATLKSIRYKVNELCHLMTHCLGVSISQEFSDCFDPQNMIQMLFECFHNNLCVFTGHQRTGYRILASREYALIHPSSFLSQKKTYPEFIIYEDLVSARYITHLTPVPFEFVMEYLQKGILNFSSSDLFDFKLFERVIDIGEKVISKVLLKNGGRKAREIEDNIKKQTGAEVVLIEPDLEKSCVKIYAFPNDINNCLVSINGIFENYIQAMTNEEETKLIELKKGQNNVLIEIKLTKGAESILARHVLRMQHPLKQNTSHITTSLTEFGQISTINYSLKLSWLRRVCTGEGYMKLKNKNDFNKARMLSLKYIPVGEFTVYVTVMDVKEYQLLLSEVPPEVNEKDLVDSFTKLLAGCDFEIQLCFIEPFENSCDELREMKKQIEENCRAYTNMNDFEVTVQMPELSSKYMTAFVNVFENRCLNREAENLSVTKVNDRKLSCQPLYFSYFECCTEVYDVLKYCIKEELQAFTLEHKVRGKTYSYKATPGKDDVKIKLSSNDIEIIKSLQVLINRLLDGIKLDKTNLQHINKLFCHGGHIFLKTLEKTENVHIMKNYETKTIRLFGLRKNCNYVRQYICNFLKDTESEVVKNIILSTEKQNRIILKTMITQYGANLEKFIELCGLRSAALNIKTSCLSLYGKKEGIEKAEECINALSSNTNLEKDVFCDISSEEICPVCYTPAESLSIRLQHCGHLYCSECARGLIEQAQFPIQCCKENCSKPVILQDIKNVLDDDVAQFNNLAERSLKAYLDKNRDNIFYCPAADCTMFAYKKELTKKWHCPLCKSLICVDCNVVYHEGYSCDMYRGSKADPDYSFKVWQKTVSQCRQCPNCKTAIEKKSGCNHMTCSACDTHFCWLCLQKCSNGKAVYDHIKVAHLGQLFTDD